MKTTDTFAVAFDILKHLHETSVHSWSIPLEMIALFEEHERVSIWFV